MCKAEICLSATFLPSHSHCVLLKQQDVCAQPADHKKDSKSYSTVIVDIVIKHIEDLLEAKVREVSQWAEGNHNDKACESVGMQHGHSHFRTIRHFGNHTVQRRLTVGPSFAVKAPMSYALFDACKLCCIRKDAVPAGISCMSI